MKPLQPKKPLTLVTIYIPTYSLLSKFDLLEEGEIGAR